MESKIIGRSNDHHRRIQPDAHGNHILGNITAQPDTRIEAVSHDIGLAIVDCDLHLDIGIFG